MNLKFFFRKILLRFLPRFIEDLSDCQTVLDLGCGYNSPLQYTNVPFKTGVDLFDPYLQQSQKKGIYNKYIKEDITKVEFGEKSFDAVVAIEVLEHLSKPQGLELLKKMEKWARKKVIIHTPNGFLKQDGYDNNVLQEHKSGWTLRDFQKAGFKVFGMDGLKYLKGYRGEIKYKPKFLWKFLSILTQEITYFFPELAFDLYAIKEIK